MAVVRVLYWILGCFAIMIGLFFLWLHHRYPGLDWRGWPAAGALLVGGLLYCMAGAKNYRGQWPYALGLLLLCLAACLMGVDTMSDPIADIDWGLEGAIIILGALSLLSGHKLHKYSLVREAAVPLPSQASDRPRFPFATSHLFMRLVFWILGLCVIAAGLYCMVTRDKPGGSILLCCSDSGICVVAGLLCCVAGAKNYRGHWSFVVGLASLSVAAFIIGEIIFGQLVKGPEDKALACMLLGFLFTCGLLSLWSAQKLHVYSVEAEDAMVASSSSKGSSLALRGPAGIPSQVGPA